MEQLTAIEGLKADMGITDRLACFTVHNPDLSLLAKPTRNGQQQGQRKQRYKSKNYH
jgi:hypothetical protein